MTRRKGNVALGFGLIAAALLLFALSFVEFGDSTRVDTSIVATDSTGTSRITQKSCGDLGLPDTDTTCTPARDLIDADHAIDHPWLTVLAVLVGIAGLGVLTGYLFGGAVIHKEKAPGGSRGTTLCLNCGSIVLATDRTCPRCGYSLPGRV